MSPVSQTLPAPSCWPLGPLLHLADIRSRISDLPYGDQALFMRREDFERLGIHIEHYRAALDQGGQVAKRLNFLLQEMHREVTTISSKASDAKVGQIMVSLKEETEKLREQVQNLE